MSPKVKEQLGLEDVVVEDPELEELLEKRQTLKSGVSEYRKADKEAKAKIDAITQPTPFRVGRFVVAKSATPERSVAFDVMASERYTIKVMGEEVE